MISSLRLLPLATAFVLLVASCTGGGNLNLGDRSRPGAERSGDAADVKPPPAVPPQNTARVGMILSTNSRSWQKLLGSPNEKGVTVLYVQPGGPSSLVDIKPGDVITKVDGKATTNSDRSVVLLRSRPNERRQLEFVRAGETDPRTVTVQAKVPPPNVNLIPEYTKMIEAKPEDPVPHFLRAWADKAPFAQALADVEKAVELSPGFVEGILLRAELLWNQAAKERDANRVDEMRRRALEDWNLGLRLEPESTRGLVGRAYASIRLGTARSGRADAQKAIAIDPTVPGAYFHLAQAYEALGQDAQAAEPARRAIDLNPYHVPYYALLAQIFMKLDRKADARKTVDAVLKEVPDAPTREALLKIVQG